MRLLITVLCSTLCAPTAWADDTTNDLQSLGSTVEAAAHPHAILDVLPNKDAALALEVLSSHDPLGRHLRADGQREL